MRSTTANTSYVAKRTPFGLAVFVERDNFGRPLKMRNPELVCGSGWRDSAAGSLDLASAILTDACGDESVARRLSPRFSREVISALPVAGFRLSRRQVLDWVGRPAVAA